MPYSRFISRIKFLCAVIFAVALTLTAHGAEWRECEAAKLRALQWEKKTGERHTSKRKSQRKDNRHQRVEEIDTWLWKNCREYAYELRQLEQEKM